MVPWDRIAAQYGYKSPEAMFRAIYPTQSVEALSRRFGCSVTAVRAALRKNSIELRQRGGPQPTVGLEHVSMEEYKQKGARQIADEHECDITTVYKHFRRRSAQQQQTEPTSDESPETTPPADPAQSQ